MLLGNLLALLQDNVKRVLAYSSIAHLGYILVGFLASSNLGAQAATFYLIAYFITTLGSFGIIAVMSSGGEEDAEDISNYEGLFWTRPLLALVFTAMLLSLAGIPLTAGFIGKYYVLTSGIDSDLWYLVITLVAGSAIGLYYYLRIIAVMFRPSPEANLLKPQFNAFNTLALALLTVMVVWYGVYPTGMISLINTMMGA
jgi:NADH-quinone oxidoreductase subunit N